MFTGIVQAIGRLETLQPQADGMRMSVSAGALGIDDVQVGDSIAVEGCCLTVVQRDIDSLQLAFDVSGETLGCTKGFAAGSGVNLEKALRLADRLGGHLMSGHIDGVGVVVEMSPVAASAPGAASMRLVIDARQDLARYIANKGSIAVNGVSLTVNGVQGARFEVNLIPHTLAATTLRDLASGARVNLEVDLLARYVERLRGADSIG
ncbi:MAG: riboflavin synthase [Pseudomonadota bacterium]|nr:riboflavin synthase [Pseudomonadota bacterium]